MEIIDVYEPDCSYEVSKLLKEKKFGCLTLSAYNMCYNNGIPKSWATNPGIDWNFGKSQLGMQRISCPSHAHAVIWIMENFKMLITIDVLGKHSYYGEKNGKYIYSVNKTKTGESLQNSWSNVKPTGKPNPLYYSSAREATEAGLLYTLTELI